MAYAASCKCDKANLSYKIADCHILLIEAIYVHAISNNYTAMTTAYRYSKTGYSEHASNELTLTAKRFSFPVTL